MDAVTLSLGGSDGPLSSLGKVALYLLEALRLAKLRCYGGLIGALLSGKRDSVPNL